MQLFRLTYSTIAKAFILIVFLFNALICLNIWAQDSKHEISFNEAIHYFQNSIYPVFDSIYRNFDEIKTLQRATQDIDTVFYYNTSSNNINKLEELKNILNDKHIVLVDDEWHSNYFNKHIELDGKLLWFPIVPYFNGFLIYHNEKSQHYSFLHHIPEKSIIQLMKITTKNSQVFFPYVISIQHNKDFFHMKMNKNNLINCSYYSHHKHVLNRDYLPKIRYYLKCNFKNKKIKYFNAKHNDLQIYTKIKRSKVIYYKIGIPHKETAETIKLLESYYLSPPILLIP